ncbi:MAG: heat-inducible transcription repressor HrcA [Candidatus Omnitrophica bacterium]|nr:heat-inducible transcription repressor HrcA [Candidatus Omnitrophota bacterium]
MDELKERQKQVLQIIVSTYVKTINPVGSQTIAKHYRDELSPATIRNEMHDLEERSYISQPHTSAGRVPTDKGYRYFVDHLMPEPKVAPHVAALVAREYRERIDNIEILIERTTKILSTLSEQAGLVVFPTFEELVLKRVELAPLGRQHLLVIWVTDNNLVQSQAIDMREEIPEGELGRIGRFLNQEVAGMLLARVQSHLASKLEDAHDSLHTLYQMAHDIVREGFPKTKQRRLAVEGSRYVLEQPEFQDWEKSRGLFKTLETKNLLSDLVCANSGQSGVQVQIGLEHHCADIWDCSVVAAQYRVNQRMAGALGVLGPRRMRYEQMVSIVDYVSRRFSEVLEQWL